MKDEKWMNAVAVKLGATFDWGGRDEYGDDHAMSLYVGNTPRRLLVEARVLGDCESKSKRLEALIDFLRSLTAAVKAVECVSVGGQVKGKTNG